MHPRHLSRESLLDNKVHLVTMIFVFLFCIVAFEKNSEANYRSPAGFLGNTMPAWQGLIISGTAPAPYVYRQGVPRIREVLDNVLKPGHAAVALDTVFAAICLLAAAYLASLAFGRRVAPLGMVAGLAATLSAYPNDKPEAVAAVTTVILLVGFALTGKHITAAVVGAFSAFVRPEVPILLATGMTIAWLTLLPQRRIQFRFPLAPYIGAGILGLAYYGAARFVFWPHAKYAAGGHVFMLVRNLHVARAIPDLFLSLVIVALAAMWIKNISRNRRVTESAAVYRQAVTRIGLALFIAMYAILLATVAQAEELRVYAPILLVTLFMSYIPVPVSEENLPMEANNIVEQQSRSAMLR